MRKMIKGLLLSTSLLLSLGSAAAAPSPEGPTGKVTQPLVGGTVMTADEQERLGLVTITTGCSGSLLRNDWVLTAAHCVEDDAGALDDPATVMVTATWGAQSRNTIEIITFRPADIALIQVDRPFTVNGSTMNVTRSLDRTGVYASDIGKPMGIYGRGISKFAVTTGAIATPSFSDQQYRQGQVALSSVAHGVYTYAGGAVAVAGGDSGGPTIRLAPYGDILGVHSSCEIQCVAGQMCGAWTGPGPKPGTYSNWRWVAATPNCSDASVHPVAQQIIDTMNARRLTEAPQMTVEATGGKSSVRYVNPTIRSEYGVRLRLDLCREWGANCGEPAATAFCQSMNTAKPIAASFKRLNNVGPTAIISSGQACRDAGCDSFAAITCDAPPNEMFETMPAGNLSDMKAPDIAGAMVTERSSVSVGALTGASSVNTACASGFVWRTARPEDLVCVTPAARSRVAEENRLADSRRNPAGAYGPNTCISGYVWRAAFEGDVVCVTPDSRTAAREENSLGASRRAQ